MGQKDGGDSFKPQKKAVMKKSEKAPDPPKKSIGGMAHQGRNSKVDYKKRSALKMKCN